MRYQAQVLQKRPYTLGKLVNTHTKGITLLCIGQNNICISCVFNGFKYIYERGSGTYTKIVKLGQARTGRDYLAEP